MWWFWAFGFLAVVVSSCSWLAIVVVCVVFFFFFPVIFINYSGYITLLCCLNYFIVLKVKIKPLMLGILQSEKVK